MTRFLIFCLALLLLASGCAQQSDGPAAVENYLKAMVAKDRESFVKQFCDVYEAGAMTEFDSFGAVDAKLDGVDCETAGTDGDYTLVKCKGSIAVTYQGEDNKLLSLEDTVYRVVQENGDWKMCGYQ